MRDYTCKHNGLIFVFTNVKLVMFTFVNMNYSVTLHSVMEAYSTIKEQSLNGRYLPLDYILPLLEKHSENFGVEIIGRSVHEKPIHRVTIGDGKIKVLAWSQMHGNESTTTKAVLDLLNALNLLRSDPVIAAILKKCTIHIIPMLNPDGAEAYIRLNANQTDLNRDAQNLTEPESRTLKDEFDKFQPDFCFNLHDQRTIFSAGAVAEPATLSFLTPAMDEKRKIYPERVRSMQVIAGIYNDLHEVLPGRIGKYDDAYNINCTGDSFQSLGVPTILFEAGHAPEDYNREKVREYVFAALISSLHNIATGKFTDFAPKIYANIPQNEKLFNDIIIRNVLIDRQKMDVSIQYKEILVEEKITFQPIIEKIASKITNFAHREIEGKGRKFEIPGVPELSENVVVNKITLNNEIFVVKREYFSK